MTRRAIALVTSVGMATTLLGVAGAPAGAEPSGDELPVVSTPDSADSETLVAGVIYSFGSGSGSRVSTAAAAAVHSSVQSALRAGGASVAGTASAVDEGATWAAEFAEPVSVDEAQSAADAIAAVPGVTDVELDYVMTIAAQPPVVPSDTYFREYQWDLWDFRVGTVGGIAAPVGGYSSHALSLWPATTGKGVVVAVLDTGQTDHGQLDGKTVQGYDMISSASTARDGSGRDRNPHDQGDWTTASTSSWHGTHVAGIIGAKWDGRGTVGVAPSVRIQHVRVLGRAGGSMSDIAAGITWASGGKVAGTPKNKTPAQVLNLSLGGRSWCGGTLQDAIDGARKRGSVVVVAAGNDDDNANYYAPGNCDGVVTVASIDDLGQRASYSNKGAAIDLAAQGGGGDDRYLPVLSTWNNGTTRPGGATYGFMVGTSQATPHVSAAAALLFSLGMGRKQVEKSLLKATSPFPAYPASAADPEYNCTVKKCGAGYLDLSRVLAPVGSVTIKGTPKVREVVTAKFSKFTGKVTRYKYQWYRSGKAIKGATGASRKLTKADSGRTLKVLVKPVGALNYVAVSKLSTGFKVR